MKKIIIILIVLFVLFIVNGCGNSGDSIKEVDETIKYNYDIVVEEDYETNINGETVYVVDSGDSFNLTAFKWKTGEEKEEAMATWILYDKSLGELTNDNGQSTIFKAKNKGETTIIMKPKDDELIMRRKIIVE